MVMRQKSFEYVYSLKDKQGNDTNQRTYQGEYEMDLVNIDNPQEVVTHTAFAQGMDGGDKAPGKAHTYAAKLMLVKGFGIETGDDEESRAEKMEKMNTIDEGEQSVLAGMINGDQNTWQKVCAAYNISHLSQIPKSKFEEVKVRLTKLNGAKNGNN